MCVIEIKQNDGKKGVLQNKISSVPQGRKANNKAHEPPKTKNPTFGQTPNSQGKGNGT